MNSNKNSIKQSDFILLIFNCEKYRYKAIKQKETWLKDFTIMPYFHVIGNPHLNNNYVFDYDENILYVKVEDDYNSLPNKVISAYSAINKEYSFKYIFKTDDDQCLTNIHFFNIIQNILLTKKMHLNIFYSMEYLNLEYAQLIIIYMKNLIGNYILIYIMIFNILIIKMKHICIILKRE